MNILNSRSITRDTLPYKALFMPWFAYYAAFFVFVIIFIQGYESFFDFTASKFFTAYISIILFVVLWLGSQFTLYRKDPWFIPIADVDIDSDSRVVDEEVWDETPQTWYDRFWDFVL
ncbi:unnamed protein product [[Candida] boidinii]|nr:unnamed protein product [[Candida] boidinii]